MALCALGLAVVSLVAPDIAKLLYAVTTSGVLCVLAFMWMPSLLARCNLYLFLQEVCLVSYLNARERLYAKNKRVYMQFIIRQKKNVLQNLKPVLCYWA